MDLLEKTGNMKENCPNSTLAGGPPHGPEIDRRRKRKLDRSKS